MKTCESCGKEFSCGMNDTKTACWCTQVPSLKTIPKKYQDCLCPKCLVTFVKERQESPPFDQLKESIDYYYENGFLVFTEKYHLNRGYCCDSGCRHCPYKN